MTENVKIEIEIPENLKGRVEEILEREVPEEEFLLWLSGECEYWLGGENMEFERGLEDSVLQTFE